MDETVAPVPGRSEASYALGTPTQDAIMRGTGRRRAFRVCWGVADDAAGLTYAIDADVVLVGVSRTSKTPTCMYLANCGLKAANVPFVPEVPLPDQLLKLRKPLVVGLTTSSERLSQIRRNRLLSLRESGDSDYSDPEVVADELAEAKRVFARNRWPTIDVTRKSIEESAAAILSLYQRRKEEQAV